MADLDDPERLRRERDLYRALLELGHQEEVEPFLDKALTLIVDVVGARRGYIELADDPASAGDARFWIARGCSSEDVAEIRDAVSRGVIAEALATGRTIATASALHDPRFRDRGSVRMKGIEAVLCAPVGRPPPLGVLYLQDRIAPGPFTDEDGVHAEVFARTVAVFAKLLLLRRRLDREDLTGPLFQRLVHVEGLVGRSPALATLLQRVLAVAAKDAGVLLTGPSGTGKTRIARLLHDNSPRAGADFKEVNCATLTETLFESELFGAAPGAHSTATRRVEGKIAAAEKGTLFLDEVAEIPLSSQAKLLQFLESKEYYPLGSSRPARADVRVIAATNSDLSVAVEQRRFRADLFYRLEVVQIPVPSLAERREDIPDLVRCFCERFVEEDHHPRVVVSEGALAAAQAAEWPGNIRQLANRVRKALILAADEGALQIERRHLFPDGRAARTSAPVLATSAPSAASPLTFQEATRGFQADLLRAALEEARWNITETAARLDLTRSHVYNLIKAFALGRPHD
jgi:transcriptional regulator with GAF, ATPase, and Fis domain